MADSSNSNPGKVWRLRLRWLLIGVLLVGAILAVGISFSGSQARPQPIRFSHQLHTKQAKCIACHQFATKLAPAGTPRLADCLDCHEGTQSKTPEGQKEEAKLEVYAKSKTEIPWARITPPLASHVYFSHRRHVTLEKIECSTCHGGIAQTAALPSKPALRFAMDFCVSCHEKRGASIDCVACHR